MTLLLTFARWLGLRGAVALLALVLVGVQHMALKRSQTRLALSEARVAVLEAQRDAANQLADDYRVRAEVAAQEMLEAIELARKAEAVRAKKWREIRQRERAWSETPVPAAVVEGLR